MTPPAPGASMHRGGGCSGGPFTVPRDGGRAAVDDALAAEYGRPRPSDHPDTDAPLAGGLDDE